jgi:hypothetical protein
MFMNPNPHDALNELDTLAYDQALQLARTLMNEGYEEVTALSIAIAWARRWTEHRHDPTRERNLHVLPHPYGWALRRAGVDSDSFIFSTRDEACEYAFDLAERDGTMVMIHDASGQIEDQIRFEQLPLS